LKCARHSYLEAIGQCARCTMPGCRICIRDIAGTLICRRCTTLSDLVHEENTYLDGAKAKRRLRDSLIAASVGAFLGLVCWLGVGGFEHRHEPRVIVTLLLAPLVCAGITWSFYWGGVRLRPSYRLVVERRGWVYVVPLLYWLALVQVGVLYLSLIAVVYGVFGGALVQHLRHKRLARVVTGQ